MLGNRNRVLPISSVALSLPAVVSATGAGPVLEVPLAVNELLGLQASARTLRAAYSALAS